MIRVTVGEAAQKRGVKNPKQLADLMECNPAIIWKVWTGAVTPTLQMIDRICEALKPCDLDELIHRVPDKKGKASPARQGGQKTATGKRAKAGKSKRSK